MFRFSLCLVALLASPAAAQQITECDPQGTFDVFVTQDLLVDRTYDWWCDAHVFNGAEIKIVSGGAIYGNPRFDEDSYVVLEDGGYLQSMNTEGGYPFGFVSGGTSDYLMLIDADRQSEISGGVHKLVDANNLLISGGVVNVLSLYDFAFWSGGSIDAIEASRFGKNVVVVHGSNLSSPEPGQISGTLLDGTRIDHYYPGVNFIIADTSALQGDGDSNGKVDLDDLNSVRNNFGFVGYSPYDFNFDGRVGLEDLNTVRNNFGSASQSSSVPEPSTLAMALVAFALAGIPSPRRCHSLRSPSP